MKSIDFGDKMSLVRSGGKTQTRIVLDGIPLFSKDYDRQWRPHTCPPGGAIPTEWSWWEGPSHGPSLYHWQKIDFKNGDKVWVREPFFATWGDRFAGGNRIVNASLPQELDGKIAHATEQNPIFVYYASDPPQSWNEQWRPASEMEEWASRTTASIVEVNVRRLQDFNRDDAIAEGFSTKEAFAEGWKATRGMESWDANPWVIVLDFVFSPENVL